MFEELESIDATLVKHHWQWILRWPLPWHGITRLLKGLADVSNYMEADRAWRQVDIIFRRHNNEDFSMVNVPAWRMVERLCDQAMLTHSSRVHAGSAYSIRHPRDDGHPCGAPIYSSLPATSSQEMYNTGYADIEMFNQLPNDGFNIASWLESSASTEQPFSGAREMVHFSGTGHQPFRS
jgi:hypothetical protein